MKKILTIYLSLSLVSCGILKSNKKKCNTGTYSSTKKYTLNIIDYKESYNSGDQIVLSMDSDQYSFGQAKLISLFHNNNQIYSFGKWLVFNSNKKEITLPKNMISEDSECFDVRIFYAADEVYISKTFLIKNK